MHSLKLDQITLLNRKFSFRDNKEYRTSKFLINEFSEKLNAKNQSTKHWEARSESANFDGVYDSNLGKLTEVAANKCMKKYFNYPLLKIDIEIRHGIKKGWQVDLPYSQADPTLPNCHVKGCDSNNSRLCDGNRSWTFQLSDRNGNGGTDPLFKNPESKEMVIFMYLEHFNSLKAEFVAIAPWYLIYPHLEDPVTARLRGIKKCIYENKLKELCSKTVTI